MPKIDNNHLFFKLREELESRSKTLQDIYRRNGALARARWRAHVEYGKNEGAELLKPRSLHPLLNQMALDYYRIVQEFSIKLSAAEFDSEAVKKCHEAFIQNHKLRLVEVLTECKNLMVWDFQNTKQIADALIAIIYGKIDPIVETHAELSSGMMR